MNFCEKCGTKINETARFCASCGFELHPDKKTSDRTRDKNKHKKLRIKISFLTTTSIITTALLGLVFFFSFIKPAEQIVFSEIKLTSSKSQYTWVGEAPQFKVAFKSKEETFNDVTLKIEKQDTQGQWYTVASSKILESGLIELKGGPSYDLGKEIYRASVFQGEKYVASSKTKSVVFLPKKNSFTYDGTIGYRYFTPKEYENSPCPGVNGCWGFHIVSRAKVRLEIKVMNGGKAVSKTVKVDLPNINKVRVVKVSSLSQSPASGHFDYAEELLTSKDLKRIALDSKKKLQNKPVPLPTKTKKPTEWCDVLTDQEKWEQQQYIDSLRSKISNLNNCYLSCKAWEETLQHFIDDAEIRIAAQEPCRRGGW